MKRYTKRDPLWRYGEVEPKLETVETTLFLIGEWGNKGVELFLRAQILGKNVHLCPKMNASIVSEYFMS